MDIQFEEYCIVENEELLLTWTRYSVAAPVLSFVEAFQFKLAEHEYEQLKSGSAISIGTDGELATGGVLSLDTMKLSIADHAETSEV